MWLVEGIVAYVTGLNKVGAIILVLIGIGGLISALRHERKKEAQ